ncbi:hypothetical protein A2703_02580 [Candidatus Collierbacteria bacterium RIFCSPHIGHO2_01_FULL_50_25]|uniref:Uncharacterized protein n=1 Tax=Candidatus Collierbacteria bacterium RIFCSPHIGHO2_01_FULL_50_25 TaxID=1817722 RepID=A0A1F5EV03_9BACT|nr:MAG: hypothetical protein A2703_02580 [Candidatus Collierbacteria bacterium RIFCSPHIGHO2_01_FULL_50_25]
MKGIFESGLLGCALGFFWFPHARNDTIFGAPYKVMGCFGVLDDEFLEPICAQMKLPGLKGRGFLAKEEISLVRLSSSA